MAIRFRCGRCGQAYTAKREVAGKQIKCRKCRNVITVPVPSAASLSTTLMEEGLSAEEEGHEVDLPKEPQCVPSGLAEGAVERTADTLQMSKGWCVAAGILALVVATKCMVYAGIYRSLFQDPRGTASGLLAGTSLGLGLLWIACGILVLLRKKGPLIFTACFAAVCGLVAVFGGGFLACSTNIAEALFGIGAPVINIAGLLFVSFLAYAALACVAGKAMGIHEIPDEE